MKVKIYKRFERFWHWSQAALVLSLAATGFEIHGVWSPLGFGKAVQLHTVLAWSLLGLWAFAIFWHFTTGEWRNYVPSTRQLLAVARFYAVGIFHGEEHPYRKRPGQSKLNPLQRIAYLGLKLVINPVIIVSGLLYLYYNSWAAWGLAGLSLGGIALVHTAAAFAMAIFVVVHVYLTTTGHTVFAHIKAMITGWEEDHGDSGTTHAPAE